LNWVGIKNGLWIELGGGVSYVETVQPMDNESYTIIIYSTPRTRRTLNITTLTQSVILHGRLQYLCFVLESANLTCQVCNDNTRLIFNLFRSQSVCLVFNVMSTQIGHFVICCSRKEAGWLRIVKDKTIPWQKNS